MHPKTDGILESSLYVSDVVRSTRFYQETFGFPVISEFGERGCEMHAGTRQVLLLFKKGGFAGDPVASRWRRRITRRVRYSICRIEQLGDMAPGKRNRGGRETRVGIRRLEPLLSRPGPPFDRTRHAGHMAGLLKRVDECRALSRIRS
jgi:hypothetical protein